MNASPSYVHLLATYPNFSEKEAFSKAYERSKKIFWGSQGFYEFLAYSDGKDIGLSNLERLLGCGLSWREQKHKKDKNLLRYCPHGCGDTLFCGRCALAKVRQRASHGFRVFCELIKACSNNGIRLKSKGLEIELTIPRWLSEIFCDPSNRSFLRQWTDRFYKVGNRAIQRWFKEMGVKGKVSGVNVLHFWKSGAPWKPHVHLHCLLAPVYMTKDKVLHPLPRWYEEKDLNLLRDIWKEELEKEFGEGIEETLNVCVNYLKRIKRTKREGKGRNKKGSSVEFRLGYMFRPPIQDFTRCIKKHLGKGRLEVEMIPEGARDHKERIKGIVPYSEVRNFFDLIDAFSVSDLRGKKREWDLERKVKEMEQKTTLSLTLRKREGKKRLIGEEMRQTNPKLYGKLTQKGSKKTSKGKGGLERIRWFGFLSKRSLGEFFKSLEITKEKVEPEWEDTGRQLEYIGKTDIGIELKDVETGEVIEIPSILIHDKPLNISGRKWVWKYQGKRKFPDSS